MSKNGSNCFVFAGPTLAGVAVPAGVKVLPPVKRGDVEKLISTRAPGTMAIVDGQFHQCLSVGHAEIRSALRVGWQVWGLSSMGAIRAYEMREMGMLGFGYVYKWFDDEVDFRDDEVALLHEAGPSYRALSEPLVHIRLWLKELKAFGLIGVWEEKRLVYSLMNLWFGNRTLDRARSLVLELIPDEVERVDETLGDFDRYRVKTQDLRDFFHEKPWG